MNYAICANVAKLMLRLVSSYFHLHASPHYSIVRCIVFAMRSGVLFRLNKLGMVVRESHTMSGVRKRMKPKEEEGEVNVPEDTAGKEKQPCNFVATQTEEVAAMFTKCQIEHNVEENQKSPGPKAQVVEVSGKSVASENVPNIPDDESEKNTADAVGTDDKDDPRNDNDPKEDKEESATTKISTQETRTGVKKWKRIPKPNHEHVQLTPMVQKRKNDNSCDKPQDMDLDLFIPAKKQSVDSMAKAASQPCHEQ
ncbi:hypothetical protein RIF29_24028 [Crotalaria pallida]|uniref:Uncharacterized protein n=1 Tax=Crotalaria pallida TaxID=3830 RepID=A0AAN9EP56_CROPI